MVITLKIDNVDSLPGGAPLSFRSAGGSFRIGREGSHWVLPDPSKIISGSHCEIRFDGGAYWLHDRSRNGTFVNGSSARVTSPYRLASGDRLRIGHYIICVFISEQEREAPSAGASGTRAEEGVPSPARISEQATPASDPFFGGAASRRHLSAAQHPATVNGAQPAHAAIDADEIFRCIAAAAGVPADVFQARDRREIAAEIGAILRIVVDELAALLRARAAAKVLAKSAERTMIGPAENNPLKFVPASEDILEIMFTRRRPGYLDAKQSIGEAFRDLRTHETATYIAMQAALFRLLEDISPDSIERKLPVTSFMSRKGRAWEAFVAAWRAREEPYENGMLDVFLVYFSEAYAKATKQKS